VRRQRFQGAEVYVVHQLDGTLAHIPCWMLDEAAARHELSPEPRLPLEHLRDLRIEVDSLLGVSGGEKVGQWSGSAVLVRGGVITGHWLG
jgi:hypothetical protein